MATKEEIVQIYIGYYDRASDATGLNYWSENAADWPEEDVAKSFAEQDETIAKYPDTLSTPEFVNTIYVNVFNRDADADGLDYWVKALEAGEVTQAEMILAVMNGAQGDDKVILDNKTEVGTYFADRGEEGYDDAVAALDGIDAEEASVIAAKDEIDSLNPLALTSAKDTLVGFDTDDVITGSLALAGSTYTNGDSIDGGEGQDTFNLKTTGAGTDPIASISNVETINIIETGATSISAANWTGVENVNFTKTAAFATANLMDLGIELKDFNIQDATSTIAATVNVIGDVYQGDNDTAYLTISKATSTAAKITFDISNTAGDDIVENIALTSSGNVSSGGKVATTVTATLNVNDTAYKSITVDGDSDIAVATAATATKLATIDASALTGELFYTTTTATGTTVTGGSKADTIVAATGATVQDTIIGRTGADQITLDGSDLVKILYKEDSGTTTASADVIFAFATGSDQINVVGLAAGSASNYIARSDTAISSIELAVAAANEGEITGKEFVFYTDGTDGYLTYDMDNSGTVDGAIKLDGITALAGFAATDIV